jgi:hypothetical protein
VNEEALDHEGLVTPKTNIVTIDLQTLLTVMWLLPFRDYRVLCTMNGSFVVGRGLSWGFPSVRELQIITYRSTFCLRFIAFCIK